MSKVLIDRELLERAVYRLELAYDADAPIICDLSSVLSAPSGTPAMPVKAYYHESTRETGAIHRSVGLEVRKAFIDAPLVLESDALARIACLEGEIAKRDVELERLRAELSAAKETISRYETTAENCDLLRGELAALRDHLASHAFDEAKERALFWGSIQCASAGWRPRFMGQPLEVRARSC